MLLFGGVFCPRWLACSGYCLYHDPGRIVWSSLLYVCAEDFQHLVPSGEKLESGNRIAGRSLRLAEFSVSGY